MRRPRRLEWRAIRGSPGDCEGIHGLGGALAAPGGGTRSITWVSDRITAADVVKVAKLARLDLTSDEIVRTTAQLDGMLEHFADMDALDLESVVPMTQPYPLHNVFRDDMVVIGLDHDEVLAAAPRSEDGRFWVPPIIGLDS